MLRKFLLGKMSVSILASLLVGAICLSQPCRNSYEFPESARWIGIGIFFLLLGLVLIVAMVLMLWRR